ncbi:DNA-directed DNA polymerase [Alteripontixanthobacter maritimus]|uniref:DNA-directed DNA polymerase n=2 Tax=Alteripontixanthobacter maritimus TaxID=2161824 RepID=A0A369Q649_9SPHN|nr:DNA-directed DNA polymerase [Alteripontixanthobacter maritimus]
MHHAWLLAGKQGVGKRHFAEEAAADLVRSGGGGDSDGLTNVASHPDIHILTHLPKDDKENAKREKGEPYERKRNIPVGQIRAMQQRLNTRPTMGSRRAIIIDPADDMEAGASNALLKSLEEPPEGTFFLLVAHRPAQLLPTIRSRCRLLRFPTLADAEMQRVLADHAPEAGADARSAAISAAAGSPGAALDFLTLNLGKVDAAIRRILAEGDDDFSRRGDLSREIGGRPSRKRIQAVLDLACGALARAAPDAAGSNRIAMIDAHDALVRLSGEVSTYNYDAGLLAMEIGTLLANAAPHRDRAHG